MRRISYQGDRNDGRGISRFEIVVNVVFKTNKASAFIGYVVKSTALPQSLRDHPGSIPIDSLKNVSKIFRSMVPAFFFEIFHDDSDIQVEIRRFVFHNIDSKSGFGPLDCLS